MNPQDFEFFDLTTERGLGIMELRCLSCFTDFEVNFGEAENVVYSIRYQRSMPRCPSCASCVDIYAEEDSDV